MEKIGSLRIQWWWLLFHLWLGMTILLINDYQPVITYNYYGKGQWDLREKKKLQTPHEDHEVISGWWLSLMIYMLTTFFLWLQWRMAPHVFFRIRSLNQKTMWSYKDHAHWKPSLVGGFSATPSWKIYELKSIGMMVSKPNEWMGNCQIHGSYHQPEVRSFLANQPSYVFLSSTGPNHPRPPGWSGSIAIPTAQFRQCQSICIYGQRWRIPLGQFTIWDSSSSTI